ncbi:serine hydrolase domain-containing protein [Winogradskyella sp. HB-48]|uniref:serine hydrolase domain-containing protein n=1 Tax=Winogradskyella sp. HB-48 TaxID=3416808 RepID=UPI003CF6F028
MKNSLIYCLILFFIFSCKQTQKQPEVLSKEEGKTQVFQSILDSIYDENKDAVGLLVHIESPKKGISWSGSSGFSDKEKSKLQPKHPFLIASNTKTYVSAAVLRLVEQSKLDLNQTIDTLIFETTNDLLKADGYNTAQIKIAQLLNHTSGIHDYAVTNDYAKMLTENPKHRYTRDEQIKLALTLGEPLGKPEEVFSYADVNYLLLTEIIEGVTQTPFYTSIRELINYEKLGLYETWFSTLEEYPEKTLPLAYQYSTSEGLDSYLLDHSADLYGGGGIAATCRDLAIFCQSLFNHKIFDKENTLDLIYTKAEPVQPMEGEYYLGLSPIDVVGLKGYGHNGYWGTAVYYFPELDASIAVSVLERDQRELRQNLFESFVKVMKKM